MQTVKITSYPILEVRGAAEALSLERLYSQLGNACLPVTAWPAANLFIQVCITGCSLQRAVCHWCKREHKDSH